MLFDALGTLVRLEPPWPLLAGALSMRGIEITLDEAREGMRAEMTYYLEHHVEGRDERALAELRARCAAVLGRALPPAAAGLGERQLTEALLEALRFAPFPDAVSVLGLLRARGVRTGVVSNWDCSLGSVLSNLGVGGLLDAVVTSAEAGYTKPDPRIFERALGMLEVPAARAVFVGDSLAIDVRGGRAAGMRSVLLDRGATEVQREDVERILTLEELPALMDASPIV